MTVNAIMTLYFTGKLTVKIVDTYYTDRPDLKKKKIGDQFYVSRKLPTYP